MRTIVLIPCVKEKLRHIAAAGEMYNSQFFTDNLTYAISLLPDMIFVLSGKYGALTLDDIIEPYDVNLHLVSENELIAWSDKVLTQLSKKVDLDKDQFIILVDEVYRKHIVPSLKNWKIHSLKPH